jgi:HemY protein
VKALLTIWVFVFAGAVVGIVLSHDSGYVLLAFGNYTIETSLALLVLLIAALFVALYIAIRLVAGTLRMPRELRAWQQRRDARLAQQAMTRGLLDLSEGNWREAERRLVRFAGRSETPLLNYLAAARAAQLQGAHERRDSYLSMAHESMPSAEVAVGLTQVELQLADRQLEQALATLRHLRQLAPRHDYVLRLLRRLYEQLGDWAQLRDLLPELRRRRVEDDDELLRLELRTHRALLEQAFIANDVERLQRAWAQVPRPLRDEPQVVGDYAGYLQEAGRDADAERLLLDALHKHWDDGLVETVGLLEPEEPGKLLRQMDPVADAGAPEPARPALGQGPRLPGGLHRA